MYAGLHTNRNTLVFRCHGPFKLFISYSDEAKPVFLTDTIGDLISSFLGSRVSCKCETL